jgi:hypothetical protein
MKVNQVNLKVLIKIFLSLLLAIVGFHFCIIAKIIPYNIAWGGRLQNDSEMYVFESISILINLFLGFVLLMKGEFIRYYIKQNMVDRILWFFFVLFILNTIGNIFAKTDFEKFFAILTFLFSTLIWVILRGKKT